MGDFLSVPEEDNPLLFDADVMFLDANTWHPAEQSRHQSVLGNLRLIDKWRPKRAYMIHYSGYEDREHANDPVNGPMELQHDSATSYAAWQMVATSGLRNTGWSWATRCHGRSRITAQG